jgi:hypothetical protein
MRRDSVYLQFLIHLLLEQANGSSSIEIKKNFGYNINGHTG